MRFPAGTDRGVVMNPRDESFILGLRTFRGACQFETPAGHGFVLIDNGKPRGAYFRTADDIYLGNNALPHISLPPPPDLEVTELRLREYDDTEFALALQIARYEHLACEPVDTDSLDPEEDPSASDRRPAARIDVRTLEKIRMVPGVIAVSAFFEGFPVQSVGDADFEHVAVSAEDFLRAGSKIAREMKIGSPDQLILETATSKLIIAPCGDLDLCIFARADAQLGLIRVVLTGILAEISR
jgi:predicted regulator of Ras-like GTPase activity (Roadblock/LC7/MglB family)